MKYDPKDPMRFFKSDHLPPHLSAVVGLFRPIAEMIVSVDDLSDGVSDQGAVALQKLIEAKDAAVRQFIDAIETGNEVPDTIKTSVERGTH